MQAMVVSRLTGTPFSNSQSGYRLLKGEVLKGLPLCSSGYEVELKLLIKTCKRGHSVVNISIATH